MLYEELCYIPRDIDQSAKVAIREYAPKKFEVLVEDKYHDREVCFPLYNSQALEALSEFFAEVSSTIQYTEALNDR